MARKVAGIAILLLCMIASSECFIFDLLNFKLGLVKDFFSLFDNHWGTNSKSTYEKQGLADNAWRDSKPDKPPTNYQSKYTQQVEAPTRVVSSNPVYTPNIRNVAT